MKGLTGITDMLNLPSLEDVLKEQGIDVNASAPIERDEPQIAQTIDKLHDLTARMMRVEGTDHTDAMDNLYKEILNHARELMAYGYNMDQPRARGIFEVAATLYGHAMNAANSKRDAQLKTMRLSLDRKKVDLEERRTNHAIGQQAATIDTDNSIVVEDRNELIRRLRAQMNDRP
jgi:hypothetical protein